MKIVFWYNDNDIYTWKGVDDGRCYSLYNNINERV